MEKTVLKNPNNVKFQDLLQICTEYFGEPRISGSHHVFKMPWQGDPRINIQKDGNMAKEYQVKSVAQTIERLEKEKDKKLKRDDHGKK
jgi:CRP-like cAMP-binding protein